MQPQPDNRLRVGDLGSFTINGRRFVVNLRPGVPRNACIEEFDGALRCWASHTWLTPDAADFVRANAVPTDGNAFAWKPGVRVREVRKG